jgi:hypothetical protein
MTWDLIVFDEILVACQREFQPRLPPAANLTMDMVQFYIKVIIDDTS